MSVCGFKMDEVEKVDAGSHCRVSAGKACPDFDELEELKFHACVQRLQERFLRKAVLERRVDALQVNCNLGFRNPAPSAEVRLPSKADVE